MTHRIFVIYDSKVEAYISPMFLKTKGQALRTFTDSVNDPNTLLNKHPEDYSLFEIGQWDESSGELCMHDAKISLGTAQELLRQDLPSSSPVLSNQQKIQMARPQ